MTSCIHIEQTTWEQRTRSVIFNADDFGLSVGINAGVIASHRIGPLKSASLMVTTPGFQHAVELAGHHPKLDLGLHLALTGVPSALSPARIPSLVQSTGRFPPLVPQLRALALGKVVSQEIEDELRAQIERALETGLDFSHLDAHHHIHLFQPVASIVGRLAREYQFMFVRATRRLRSSTTINPRVALRRLILGAITRRTAGEYRDAKQLDAFRGVPFPTSLGAWQAELRSIPSGVTEFMCHPGLVDPDIAEFDGLIDQRAVELAWLCDPRLIQMLSQANIVSSSFKDLQSASPNGSG